VKSSTATGCPRMVIFRYAERPSREPCLHQNYQISRPDRVFEVRTVELLSIETGQRLVPTQFLPLRTYHFATLKAPG
jgi:hypothetical protein